MPGVEIITVHDGADSEAVGVLHPEAVLEFRGRCTARETRRVESAGFLTHYSRWGLGPGD